jgi:hypothetical protein
VDERRFRTVDLEDPRVEVVAPVADGWAPEEDDHRMADGEPRVPDGWERMHADVRREAHEREQVEQARRRAATRRAMPLHARLAAVTEQIGSMQTSAALRTDTVRVASSPSHGGGPRHASELDLAGVPGGEVARWLRTIAAYVERLEDAIDAHKGLKAPTDFSRMSTTEKDRLVIERFQDWTPVEIEAFAPELGSAKTHRWTRRKAGRRPLDGHRDPEAA